MQQGYEPEPETNGRITIANNSSVAPGRAVSETFTDNPASVASCAVMLAS
jgi:hypothetical protein